MSIRHEIRGSMLTLVVDGEYDAATVRTLWERIVADPAFRDGMPVLIDSRKTVANPSRAVLREQAEFLVGLQGRIGPRCALVVSGVLHYGLARMLAALAEPGGLEIQAFEDPARAEAWLVGRG